MEISATEIKHPYHDYSLADALKLALSLKYGPIVRPSDPLPSIPEALTIVMRNYKAATFNWITARVALELLRVANGDATEYTTC